MHVPPGEPENTRTLCPPSDNVPSLVVSVLDVPDNVMAATPLIALSSMSKLLFVVLPQVPACSPAPIFSIPLLDVYVLAMLTS